MLASRFMLERSVRPLHCLFLNTQFSVSSTQMVNIDQEQSTYTSKNKLQGPAIHIAALPTRHNQVELPSFSIPLQYNLGTFKKIGEEVQLDLEVPEAQNWDGRIIPNFNLMNLKPLIENRENINLSDLKYEVKNETLPRVSYEINNTVQAIETDDILKEAVNEGQTISPDFQLQRYQYDNEKRYRDQGFETMMEDRSNYVCDNDLFKNSFGKVDEKRGEFEECHLLDTDSNVAMSSFENNM